MKKLKFLSSKEMTRISGGQEAPPDFGTATGPGEACSNEIMQQMPNVALPPNQCMQWYSDSVINGVTWYSGLHVKSGVSC
jgi:hypothetical protein